MKFFTSFFVLLLCVVYSHQLWKYENCAADDPALQHREELDCGVLECLGNGKVQAMGCPTYSCVNPKGYLEGDASKPYPECCGGPICP